MYLLWPLGRKAQYYFVVSYNKIFASPDGKWLVCSTSDGAIQVFDWMTQTRYKTLKGQKLIIRSMCFSPVSPYLLYVACDDKLIHIYDVEHGEMVASLRGHQEGVNVVNISSNGHFIASGSVDKLVKVTNQVLQDVLIIFL